MSAALPARARVVIIGGGAIGTSIAYHLGLAGWTDVVLLERDRLTSGTTWHAAGLMTCFGATSQTSTEIRLYSRELYARLEAETGLSTGFRAVGTIEAAADADRLHEYRRTATFQRHLGLDVHEISPSEMHDLFPLAKTDDLLGGFYVPQDGRVNPVDLTMSLARGAKARGVTIIEGVSVQQVLTADGAVTGVRTDQGEIEAEYVVNAAGMWARELGERNGLVIPNQAAEHYYLITDAIEGIDPDGPVFEDPAAHGYYREEGGGLMVGLFEPVAAAWQVDGIPERFSFGTLPPDWDRMMPFLETAMSRVPITAELGIRTFFCGPESFTPDRLPIVGEIPDLRGYFVAAGLNSVGILSCGGIGRLVAHWITTGRPDADVTAISADRFHPYQLGRAYRAARAAEALGTVFAAHYPGSEMRTARGVKRSVLHDRLAEQGAWFKDVSGWESPDWYAGAGETPQLALSWHREPWWDSWAAEHRAVREAVGLIDMSFMCKVLVQGRDAGALLERVSAGHVDGDSGTITYTQWLDEWGGLQADLTVTKLGLGEFLVVASDTAHWHVIRWLRRHAQGLHVSVTDVTSAYTQVTVQGPRSRDVVQPLTSVSLRDHEFPFRAARFIDLGLARVLCVRITYVGELGYELYIPSEMAGYVYEQLVESGAAHGMRHVGLKALGSLRMEKGYRDYGHDVDNTDGVFDVGLGFAVDLDKPAGFLGRDAVVAQKHGGPPAQRLVQVALSDPHPLLYHAEIVYRDGVAVGDVRSASYGWTLGGAVGLAMVHTPDQTPITPAWVQTGAWEVDIAGVRHGARASLRPMYDPTNARVKA